MTLAETRKDNKLKYYACSRRFDNGYNCWGGPCKTRERALVMAEERIYDTYGSRSGQYFSAMNGLITMTETEAVKNGVDIERIT